MSGSIVIIDDEIEYHVPDAKMHELLAWLNNNAVLVSKFTETIKRDLDIKDEEEQTTS